MTFASFFIINGNFLLVFKDYYVSIFLSIVTFLDYCGIILYSYKNDIA